MEQGRVAAEDRHTECHGQALFQRRHGEARHAGCVWFLDSLADAPNETRPGQDLRTQRLRRRVVAAEEAQTTPGMLIGDSGQQVQVVVDDRLSDWLAGDIDQASTREAQEQQHAEHALLVVVDARDLGHDLLIEAEAG